MTPTRFVQEVAALKYPNTFNPYAERCHVHDLPDAARRRAHILERLLQRACSEEIDAIWIGRDLGYRGGRRTGLALTDDVHLSDHVGRWGLAFERPTVGNPISERTAAVIWRVLRRLDCGIFLWNVFPLHPHEPYSPFTNRAHTPRERKAGEEILAELIILLRPRRIVAVGNNAAAAAARLAGLRPIQTVRHPSYGGQADFLRQISSLYGLQQSEPLLPFLDDPTPAAR